MNKAEMETCRDFTKSDACAQFFWSCAAVSFKKKTNVGYELKPSVSAEIASLEVLLCEETNSTDGIWRFC